MSNTPAADGIHFADRLIDACLEKQAPVCVGIDPVFERLPAAMRAIVDDPDDPERISEVMLQWVGGVLKAVAEHVPAVKFQSACFERYGPHGTLCLEMGMQMARRLGLIVILDAKRGDIGISSEHYAAAAFAHADAVTVSPYLGVDALGPFIDHAARVGGGLFALVRTSNPGSDAVQAAKLADGRSVAEHIADLLAEAGAAHIGRRGYSLLGAVVGATKPDEIAALRDRMTRQIILLPGYGAQGGGAADVRAAFDAAGRGALVTASRSVIYACQGITTDDWAAPVAEAAAQMVQQIHAALT